MKRLLMAAAMLAAPALASAQALPAVTGATATQNITINGRVTAQCVINSGTSSFNLTQSLAGADGFLNASGLQSALESGLTNTNTTAWCSGNSNKVVISRTALVRNGTTGAQGADQFGNAVLYDVGVKINNAPVAGFSYTDGSSDGPGNGHIVGRFGPMNQGEPVTFVTDISGPASLLTPIVVAATSAAADGATPTFSALPGVRLSAGDYTSTVTLTITPGV